MRNYLVNGTSLRPQLQLKVWLRVVLTGLNLYQTPTVHQTTLAVSLS